MWYVPTMSYYSAIKKVEILSYATTGIINLDIFMLSKVSQSQKGKYCMIRIYDISKVVKFLEWWLPGARLRGKGKLFNRYRVLVLQDKSPRDMGIQLILLYCILRMIHIGNVMCFFHINNLTAALFTTVPNWQKI